MNKHHLLLPETEQRRAQMCVSVPACVQMNTSQPLSFSLDINTNLIYTVIIIVLIFNDFFFIVLSLQICALNNFFSNLTKSIWLRQLRDDVSTRVFSSLLLSVCWRSAQAYLACVS